jgi:hypothetical protein
MCTCMDVMDMVRWVLGLEWVLDVVVMAKWTLGPERLLVITI